MPYLHPAYEAKICPPEDLAARVAALPRPLVFTNGCFDILHRGHVTYLAQARALLHGERDRIANAANLSALVYNALPDLNWVGFYFYDGSELVVGPFQGLPACVRIPLDKGVCGAAARTRQTQRIEDVHAFPGHIACDSASNSELVVPLVKDGRLIGVLDLDSPSTARCSISTTSRTSTTRSATRRATACSRRSANGCRACCRARRWRGGWPATSSP